MDQIDRLIEGVKVTELLQIEDHRGAVYHVLKKNNEAFSDFGEVYFSKINPGIVKAWKYHKRMTQNFSVPHGKLKLVIYDDREGSATHGCINTFFLNPETDYKLITIPPGLWYGFQCISTQYSLLLNVADMMHSPTESINKNYKESSIKYDW
jgi:dTDP-4-dehydrorhamnose 3,5-epimerase